MLLMAMQIARIENLKVALLLHTHTHTHTIQKRLIFGLYGWKEGGGVCLKEGVRTVAALGKVHNSKLIKL